MKKSLNISSSIFFLISVGFGVTTYICYTENIELYKYFFGATIISVILFLSDMISKIRVQKHIKRGSFYEKRLGLWNTISYRVKKSGEHAFNELPIGIIILSNKYEIIWSNNYSKEIFMSSLENMMIETMSYELHDKLKNKEEDFVTEIYGNKYHAEYDPKYNILYLTDITDITKIQQKYDNRITALGYINVDNLENILSDFDVQERAEFMYKIVSEIATWAEKFGAYVRAYSDNSYLLIMDKSQLKLMVEDNFQILDSIKVLAKGRQLKLSLSIGIACVDESVEVLSNLAKEQLEYALNRGGDQATVMIDGNVRFYGAKADTAQALTKVTMRMKAEELQDIIKNSNEVMVVGHKGSDADSFGATLAIYRMAKSYGKNAYIILDKSSLDKTVQNIYNSIQKDYFSLLENIISPQLALAKITDETLLMVVDCQTVSQLSEPKLVKKATRIGVVDHHRRGDDAIDNLCFYLSSTAASSSVELIVQLYEFLETEIEFDKLEATWLLLGIIVDTNNFVYRCSEKTFKVASILAKYGANMTGVKKYLKEDISDKIKRYELMANLDKVSTQNVAIATSKDDVIFERAQLAKISDELISIDGYDVGITIGKLSNNVIGISARSLGTINVQILMERFGGGGHFNNAAAQVPSGNVDEIVKNLKIYIDEYIDKEEKMKVILYKEVNGKGKKDDIIEVSSGYGNHLIRSGQAVAATDENLKRLDEEKKQAELEEENKIAEMKELKKIIDETPIKIAVKVGVGGRLFGSINTKQIVDTFEKETGKTINKQEIKLDKNISALGTYKLPIDLYKNIKATITLYVIEKE